MAKLSPLNLRFIGIPTFRHFNSMVPTFKMTEKDRSNHWALWRTPKTRLVIRFIYDHQRKLLTPGKIGLKIWLTIVLYLTKWHNNNTDNWRNYWGDNTLLAVEMYRKSLIACEWCDPCACISNHCCMVFDMHFNFSILTIFGWYGLRYQCYGPDCYQMTKGNTGLSLHLWSTTYSVIGNSIWYGFKNDMIAIFPSPCLNYHLKLHTFSHEIKSNQNKLQ